MTRRDEEAEWVEVASVGEDERAEFMAGMLRAAGIECQVEGPSHSPLPENLGAFGLSRVMVPADRAAEARALIEQHEREYERSGSPSSDDEEE